MLLMNALPASAFMCYPAMFEVHEVDIQYVQEQKLDSAIGHEDLAGILAAALGKEIAFNRVDARVRPGESAIIAQKKKTKAGKVKLKFFQVDVREGHEC